MKSAGAVAPALLAGSCHKPPIPGSILGAAHARGHLLRDEAAARAFRKGAARKTDVVVIGGGIAGLAAARQLFRLGVEKVAVLELEAEAGGNSTSGRNAVSAYPWGAHYVPLPGKDCVEVRQLFEELGLITGHDSAGRAIYDETVLCSDPQERLFIHGQWEEGLLPVPGLAADERRQFAEFQEEMRGWQKRVGRDGRPAFTLPVDRSSRDPEILALDLQTMAAWMSAKGWTSEPLRWYVDYSCRDDFGGGLDEISAWAGIHYFSSRSGEAANADRETMLTWPEGNGYLVRRLAEGAGPDLHRDMVAARVTAEGRGATVEALHVPTGEMIPYQCRAVVCALPRFAAQRLWSGSRTFGGLVYSPWMVANLTLDELPPSEGVAPAWDNVVYGEKSLGYVNATHQVLSGVPRETVITFYEALADGPPATTREWMLAQTHAQWSERVLGALSVPHPDLREHVQHLDVWLWGHGMIRPAPGFIWGADRAGMQMQHPPVFFAHSDMSGMSLFEEAYTRGVTVAEEVRGWL